MQAIKILSASTESGNTLDEYMKKCRAKFKQQSKMYIEIGKVYYNQKKFVEARKLKDTALKTITNVTERKFNMPMLQNNSINYFIL